MRGHVAKKGNNYYAVVYEGIDPATGKERHRWHAAGPRRIDAERLVNDLVKRRHNGETTTSDRTSLADYLTERWLPLQQARLRPKTYRSYKSVVDLHVVPRLGRIRLAQLQPDDLDGLYVQLLRDGNRRGKARGGLSLDPPTWLGGGAGGVGGRCSGRWVGDRRLGGALKQVSWLSRVSAPG